METIRIYDFDNCQLSKKNGMYGGAAGSKDGIVFNGQNWMIKYPKSTSTMNNVDVSYTTSPVCEFLGSHVYQILGYKTHETLLGVRHGKLVVACRDFTDENTALLEIRTIKNHANEMLSEKLGVELDSTGDNHGVDLNNLMIHIDNNPILTAVDGLKDRFFEQAVIDVYINNSDRNNGNWGVLRHFDGRPDELAPIFDNGGSFQDKLSNEKAGRILQDIAVAKTYACGTQTAYADESGSKYSVSRFIALHKKYPELRKAILKVVPMIKRQSETIKALIDSLPETFSDDHGKMYDVCGKNIKDLYKVQLDARFNRILKPEFDRLHCPKTTDRYLR